MIQKKIARLRRARQTRLKIAELKSVRLSVHRSNGHIYAQVIDPGAKVLAVASSLEPEVRKQLPNGGNVKAAALVGRLIAEKAKAKGVEQVAFDRRRQTSLDWVSYPILRFKDAPKLTYKVVQRTDFPPYGAGEVAIAAVPAAIANAIFDATGVRIREAPLTPARVRATLNAAGVM